MKKTLFTITLFVLFSITFYAQSTHWQRYYSLTRKEDGMDICTSLDGNIYVSGFTTTGNYAVGWLLKLNPLGDTIWTRIIPEIKGIFAVEPTQDSGCIIAGIYDYIIKIKSNGDIAWCLPVQLSILNDIIQTGDNNFIACGRTGGNVYFACKFSGNGVMIWQKQYPVFNTSYFTCAVNSVNGGYILGGTSLNPDYTGIILKTDTNGNMEWFKNYYMNNSGTIINSIQQANNGYIACGYNIFLSKTFILKLNNSGDTVKTFSPSFYSEYPKIIKFNSDKFYLSCQAGLSGLIISKIIAVDSNLNITNTLDLIPVRTYLQMFNINLYKGNSSGDILLAGVMDVSQTLTEEFYAARIDSALTPPPGIGIQQISSEIPKSFTLSQNYPNPFNPVTKIKFSLPSPSEGGFQSVKLLIYDLLGREVASLIPPLWGGQEGLQPGTYEVSWDASNYPGGVYFYSLIAGNYKESKKMIIIK